MKVALGRLKIPLSQTLAFPAGKLEITCNSPWKSAIFNVPHFHPTGRPSMNSAVTSFSSAAVDTDNTAVMVD
jgi:hypothetical protein